MKRLFTLLFLLSVLASAAGAQDLSKGLEAYKRGDYEAAFAEWLPLAERGNSEAQYFLANLYADDRGVPQDDIAAANWMKAAAEQGLGSAQLEMGIAYHLGLGLPRDNVLAYMWANLAAGAQKWLSHDSGEDIRFQVIRARAFRDDLADDMSRAEIKEAQRRTREWLDTHPR